MSLDDATQERFTESAERLAALGEKRIEGLRARAADLLEPLGHEVALDAATGTGPFAIALAPLVRTVLGVDAVGAMLDEARRLGAAFPNLSFREGSVYDLPVETESVDIAAIVRTLHHLERPERALEELTRVLAPGGKLVVIDQLVSEDEREAALYERIERMRDPSHVRTLPDSAVRRLIDASGSELLSATVEAEPRKLSVFLELAGCDGAQRSAVVDYAQELIDTGETAGVELRDSEDGIRFTGRVGFYVGVKPGA